MNERICQRCKILKKEDDFYNRRNKPGKSVYCKACSCEQTLERQRKLKVDCVNYKGGHCEKCGYKKYMGALQFHHLDSTKKDFALSQAKLYGFSDKIKKELDKCILVCANCHAEIHGKLL